MKKLFFIFLFLFWALLILLQYRGFFSVQASYEEILQDAIERNYENTEKNSEVIFVWTDYAGVENNTINEGNNDPLKPLSDTWKNEQDSVMILSSSSDKQSKEIYSPEKIQELWFALSNTWKPQNANEIESQLPSSGNFWGPSFETSTVRYNEECQWLFFDPCIIIWENFGGPQDNWNLYESRTPIYRKPAQIGN